MNTRTTNQESTSKLASQEGFTLLEATLAMVSFGMISLGLLSFTLSMSRLEVESRDSAIAADSVRLVVEQLQGVEFEDLFAAFNADPADDPDGPDSALGGTFQVEVDRAAGGAHYGQSTGQEKIAIDVTIRFPVDVNGILSENVAALVPGMPTDLNGDGATDCGDCCDDYRYLPCTITVSWNGPEGVRQIRIPRIFTKKAVMVLQ